VLPVHDQSQGVHAVCDEVGGIAMPHASGVLVAEFFLGDLVIE
jgi:hypothetical protein